jgi:hypothetical protein
VTAIPGFTSHRLFEAAVEIDTGQDCLLEAAIWGESHRASRIMVDVYSNVEQLVRSELQGDRREVCAPIYGPTPSSMPKTIPRAY